MIVSIFLISLIFYLPILTRSVNVLERGNDLQEFFWPIFYFAKQQILENHTLPLWNNLFFSGTPLLPDPQSPLFYPLNVIFLFLPLDQGFIASFFLHTLLGGIGMYLCAQHGLGFSKATSLFCASLYITAPKFAGYLEAGHFGLVTSWAWIPFAALSTIKLVKTSRAAWSVLLGISLAGIFYTHLLTFLISIASVIVLWLFLLFLWEKNRLQNFLLLLVSFAIAFGLIAIALLPQLVWKDYTTRSFLLNDRDVYPKWTSLQEFLTATFWPWDTIKQTDPEKVLALGSLASLLALLGFWRLRRRTKVLIAVPGAVLIALSLNNVSPLYPFLLSQDWYVLLRVATRIWFLPTLIIILLAGYGFQVLEKNINKWVFLFAALSISELLILSWLRLARPIPEQSKYATRGVYEFLKQDKDRFRVFCVTRCLSQRTAAGYGLELVEGYNTLQQKNYYNQFIQLSQVFWDKYTLTLPPMSIYNFRKIQPHAPTLADYNVKYVISPYELVGKDFQLVKRFENYLVYENLIVKPRAYFVADGNKPDIEAPIIQHSPNIIKIDVSKQKAVQVILAEVWSPGWQAKLNGTNEVLVNETSNALRMVEIKPDTQIVEFSYLPPGYSKGRFITVSTLIFLLGYSMRNKLLSRFKQSNNSA